MHLAVVGFGWVARNMDMDIVILASILPENDESIDLFGHLSMDQLKLE